MVGTSSLESKEQKFKRIASKRTQNVLDAIRKLGNCSNKGIYKYSDDDVSKMFNAIDKELKRIKTLFNSKSKNSTFNF